jgi:hypothetical protein
MPVRAAYRSHPLIASTCRVAIKAFPGDIGNIFLSVVLFSLSLIMTLIAVHRGAGPAVAAGAFSAGVAVIHGESVPRHADATPVTGVMAL